MTPRFRCQVLHLHQLGPRAGAEFLLELGRRANCQALVNAMLADYGRVSPALLRAIGGDRFPPGPMRAVPADLGGRVA